MSRSSSHTLIRIEVELSEINRGGRVGSQMVARNVISSQSRKQGLKEVLKEYIKLESRKESKKGMRAPMRPKK